MTATLIILGLGFCTLAGLLVYAADLLLAEYMDGEY